jgi:hypothetical protein
MTRASSASLGSGTGINGAISSLWSRMLLVSACSSRHPAIHHIFAASLSNHPDPRLRQVSTPSGTSIGTCSLAAGSSSATWRQKGTPQDHSAHPLLPRRQNNHPRPTHSCDRFLKKTPSPPKLTLEAPLPFTLSSDLRQTILVSVAPCQPCPPSHGVASGTARRLAEVYVVCFDAAISSAAQPRWK